MYIFLLDDRKLEIVLLSWPGTQKFLKIPKLAVVKKLYPTGPMTSLYARVMQPKYKKTLTKRFFYVYSEATCQD